MFTNKQKEQCQIWKKEFYDIANKHFRRIFSPAIMTFDLVSEVNSAIAYLKMNRIKLNQHLWKCGGKKQVFDTVGHEVAHQIVYRHYGLVEYHGSEWKDTMVIFGLPPIMSYYIDFPPTPTSTYKEVWYCPCRPHKFTKSKIEKIKSGKYIYVCKLCGGEIQEKETICHK